MPSRRRSTSAYATTCPGPWYVTWPPRLLRTTGIPPGSTTCSSRPATPCVNTGGCSHSHTSSSLSSPRAVVNSRIASNARSYATGPSTLTIIAGSPAPACSEHDLDHRVRRQRPVQLVELLAARRVDRDRHAEVLRAAARAKLDLRGVEARIEAARDLGDRVHEAVGVDAHDLDREPARVLDQRLFGGDLSHLRVHPAKMGSARRTASTVRSTASAWRAGTPRRAGRRRARACRAARRGRPRRRRARSLAGSPWSPS